MASVENVKRMSDLRSTEAPCCGEPACLLRHLRDVSPRFAHVPVKILINNVLTSTPIETNIDWLQDYSFSVAHHARQ